jgi:hypothetical protein
MMSSLLQLPYRIMPVMFNTINIVSLHGRSCDDSSSSSERASRYLVPLRVPTMLSARILFIFAMIDFTNVGIEVTWTN